MFLIPLTFTQLHFKDIATEKTSNHMLHKLFILNKNSPCGLTAVVSMNVMKSIPKVLIENHFITGENGSFELKLLPLLERKKTDPTADETVAV